MRTHQKVISYPSISINLKLCKIIYVHKSSMSLVNPLISKMNFNSFSLCLFYLLKLILASNYRFLAEEACSTEQKVVIIEKCELKENRMTYIVDHIQPITKIEVY